MSDNYLNGNMGNKDNPQQVIIYDYGRNGGNNKQLIISGSSKYYLSIDGLKVEGLFGISSRVVMKVRMSGGTASDATLVYLILQRTSLWMEVVISGERLSQRGSSLVEMYRSLMILASLRIFPLR